MCHPPTHYSGCLETARDKPGLRPCLSDPGDPFLPGVRLGVNKTETDTLEDTECCAKD